MENASENDLPLKRKSSSDPESFQPPTKIMRDEIDLNLSLAITSPSPQLQPPYREIPQLQTPYQEIPQLQPSYQEITQLHTPYQEIPQLHTPYQEIPQLLLPHQEIPHLVPPQQQAGTLSADPSVLPSYNGFSATTTPRGPSFHSSAAISSPLQHQEAHPVGPSRLPRARRNPTQAPREGKSRNVPPPYPWATNHRATVYSMDYLLSQKIEVITGTVQCKRCEKQYEMGFNLKEKFAEVGTFLADQKSSMHDRAPSSWMTPILPKCKYCEQDNSVKPLISEKKKSINWLFLLLGQMLGCCTLEQLKYFCKHTKNHRTGAKDRVLYLTYLGLCKQLDPNGPFNR